jgi:TonB-like protein
MMKLWLTRYLKSATPLPSAALSTVVHAALIGAAVIATASANVVDRPIEDNTLARFLAPPDRKTGQQPQPEMIKYVALSIPDVVGRGSILQPVDSIRETQPVSGFDERDAPKLEELAGADSVFSVVQVDSAASRYEWSAAPSYPPKMLAEKLEGFVAAQWVVDEDGYADTTSIVIVQASHPDFAKSVRDALPFMRFRPAKIGAHTVRQLVQQDFTFRITTTATADTSKVSKRHQ